MSVSVIWNLFCEEHNAEGPKLRRSAGGAVSIQPSTLGPHDVDKAEAEWRAFLDEHAHCSPILIHESVWIES